MINYKMKYFYILISIAPSLCQFAMQDRMKADVTFGEHNDRFDVTSLIRKQKKQLKYDINLDAQSEEYRRKAKNRKGSEKKEKDSWMDIFSTKMDRKKFRKVLLKNIEDQANQIANTLISRIRSMRRFQGDFAYRDNMDSEGDDVSKYEKNLKAFENVHNFKENVEDFRRLQKIVNKLHGQPTRRIVMDPENEILLHYALPMNLKIEGFLQAPLNDSLKQ